ncbi:hypothetical protein [Delftia acidovorans]|nr:hypothetical protein [Delftia acidovorans]WAT84515.1 hypothetical protein O1V13_24250 [Delftia acidovorans]
MNKWMLLVMLVATALAACSPAQPSETVDELAANPERVDFHPEVTH